jgi:ankyrin repeat protein
MAVRYGNLDAAIWLCKHGVDPNAEDEEIGSPLNFACSQNDMDVIKWLVEKKNAKVNGGGGFFRPVQMAATSTASVDVMKYLVDEKGADISEDVRLPKPCQYAGATILHLAVMSGDMDKVRWLIDVKHVDISAKEDDKGLTTLLFAAMGRNPFEVVKWLVTEKKQNVREVGRMEENVLHYACQRDFELTKWLVENQGMDVNAQTRNGTSPLHKAAEYCQMAIVQWLVEEQGANVHIVDRHGNGPEISAETSGKAAGKKIAEWLREKKRVSTASI